MNGIHERCLGLASATAFALLIASAPAVAANLVVSVSGEFDNVFGDFVGNITPGASLTGTVTLDDTVVGTFTPSPNPTFVRAEMLYTGAIVSTSLSIDGSPVSGVGGDLRIRDAATGGLAGDDKYELLVVLNTGTLGTATPVAIELNGAYGDAAISLTGTDPLFAPPPFDPGKVSNFMLTSSGGSQAFGDLDDLAGPGAPAPVPLSSPWVLGLLAVAMTAYGARTLARHGARVGRG